jgi:hypothetical protein
VKFACKVVGHELVRKGDVQLVKIKLKGVDSGMKIEMLVGEEDRARYPFGCAAVVDFSVQQSLPLER